MCSTFFSQICEHRFSRITTTPCMDMRSIKQKSLANNSPSWLLFKQEKKSQQRVHVPMTATTLVEWKRKHPWAIISYEWVNFISKNDQIIIPTDILTCPVSTNENARVSRTLEKQKALAKVDAWKLYQRWWYVINVEVSARAKRVGWRDGFIFYGKSQCSGII